MAQRVIPLTDWRRLAGVTETRAASMPERMPGQTGRLVDALERPLSDLRISVTDRCNFRCTYCMPKEVFDRNHRFLPHDDLLSFEEITRLARAFVGHGVRKIRLTGGEPLLRRDLDRLVAMLAELRTPAGDALDLTLTTNGSILAKKAEALKRAGLGRVTVSLDALDDAIFRRMNDAGFPVADVLAGIDAAERAGLGPIKVNMVVQRGVNDGEIVAMARHFRGRPVALRFIEYMDVGETNGWRMDQVVPSAEVIARVGEVFPLAPLPATAAGETAERWRYVGNSIGDSVGGVPGEIGTISSVTRAFCRDCNRARLSTEGRLFLCLFASRGHDLRGLVRSGAGDDDLSAAIASIWQGRDDRYSELRAQRSTVATGERRVEMHYIGG